MPFVDLSRTSNRWKMPKGRPHRAFGPEANVLGKSKLIRLNDEAYEALGKPKRVRVAWDSESNRLGVKSTTDTDQGGYALTTTKTGGHVISAGALLRTIGMPSKASGWVVCELVDGYLAFSPFEGLQSAQAPLDDVPEDDEELI